MANQTTTGTKDKNFDLVAVLHSALEAAWVCDQYIKDAERDGDNEAAELMRKVQERNRELAQSAKALLKKRL